MEKNFLRFGNYFKEAIFTRVSNSAKRGAAILLSVSLLSFLVIPIGVVNAETSTNENTINADVLKSYTMYGDLNGDLDVDSIDFAKMKMLLLEPLETSTINSADTINTKAAELNGDGNIDSIDIALMKQFLLRQITKFPVMNTYVSTETGSFIDVNINESFKVSLEENGSTGYSWSYTLSEENAIKLISEECFTSYAPGISGAPSQKVWTFEALKPGKYTLLYEYRRSWELDIAPIETVQVDIYVSTTTGSIINVNKNEPFKISLLEGGFVGYNWYYTVSEENALALVSKESFYQEEPYVFDAYSQTVWTFEALKPGKYTLLFKRRPIETTVQCEINVQ